MCFDVKVRRSGLRARPPALTAEPGTKAHVTITSPTLNTGVVCCLYGSVNLIAPPRGVMRYIALIALVFAVAATGCAAQHQQSPQKPNAQQSAVARELAGDLYQSDMTSQGVPAGTAWSCAPVGTWKFACTAPGYGTWTFTLPPGWTSADGFNGKVDISPGS
jgi:hypothetical protein